MILLCCRDQANRSFDADTQRHCPCVPVNSNVCAGHGTELER